MARFRLLVDTFGDIDDAHLEVIRETIKGVYGVDVVDTECTHKDGQVCGDCDDFGK